METIQFGLCVKEILVTVQLGCVRLSSDPPLIDSRVVSPVWFRADSTRITMVMMTTRVFPTAAVCVPFSREVTGSSSTGTTTLIKTKDQKALLQCPSHSNGNLDSRRVEKQGRVASFRGNKKKVDCLAHFWIIINTELFCQLVPSVAMPWRQPKKRR